MNSTQQPFTLWTKPERAMRSMDVATTAEGYRFGIAYLGEVWWRSYDNIMVCHMDKRSDACAIMERRGN